MAKKPTHTPALDLFDNRRTHLREWIYHVADGPVTVLCGAAYKTGESYRVAELVLYDPARPDIQPPYPLCQPCVRAAVARAQKWLTDEL